jgi:aryl-alcohol dehydrogenase-like predicted oxidoreductase
MSAKSSKRPSYRTLGNSQLKVSRLCVGAMMFGDQTDESVAREIVAHARDHGVNFIDTADVYSTGTSESMVGAVLKSQRDDWVLATKVGNKMSDKPNESRYSRTWVLRECDASLKRLGTDWIDIYYMHRDFTDKPLEEPLLGLEQLSRLAYRGSCLHSARTQYARTRCLPAVLQPAQPAA